MNRSIDYRLRQLAVAIQRRQMEQAAPVDPLSTSLMQLADELAGLDELGRAALLEKTNREDALDGTMGLDLTPGALDEFIADFTADRRKVIKFP